MLSITLRSGRPRNDPHFSDEIAAIRNVPGIMHECAAPEGGASIRLPEDRTIQNDYGFALSAVSFTLFPASVRSPWTSLFTRFFSALASLPAFLEVLLMSRATLLSPPGS